MNITVEVKGIKAALANLAGMQKQVAFAASRALNEVAKKVVAEENRTVASIFKGPTPRTLRAVKVFKGAKKDNLEVIVGIDNGGGNRSYQQMGKKGTVTPAQYLLAQVIGGKRADKRFEKALVAIGAMPSGKSAVFAKRSNALDQYGNLSGAKLNQIIAYFRQYKAEGYGGKTTDARKMKMMKGQLKGMKWGMAYFRGGHGTGLPDGIWERHYPNGMAAKSFIRPILIYVDSTSYRGIFKFSEIAKGVVDREWQSEFNKALDMALSTAR